MRAVSVRGLPLTHSLHILLSLKDCKSIKKKQSQQKTQHNGENTQENSTKPRVNFSRIASHHHLTHGAITHRPSPIGHLHLRTTSSCPNTENQPIKSATNPCSMKSPCNLPLDQPSNHQSLIASSKSNSTQPRQQSRTHRNGTYCRVSEHLNFASSRPSFTSPSPDERTTTEKPKVATPATALLSHQTPSTEQSIPAQITIVGKELRHLGPRDLAPSPSDCVCNTSLQRLC